MSTKTSTAYMKAKRTLARYPKPWTPAQAKRIRLRMNAARGENPVAYSKHMAHLYPMP